MKTRIEKLSDLKKRERNRIKLYLGTRAGDGRGWQTRLCNEFIGDISLQSIVSAYWSASARGKEPKNKSARVEAAMIEAFNKILPDATAPRKRVKPKKRLTRAARKKTLIAA